MAKRKNDKKTVRIFALASFLNDLGSDMIYPIWPLFVTSLGANMAVLGFLDGLGNAFVSISQALSGYLSDRLGKRKFFVWLGYLFGSLSRIGYAFSPTWHFLIPARILDRSGKMRGPPRDAIIADISTHMNRGGNFGILRTMDNLGAVCGILITISTFHLLGYRNLFLLAALPSIVAALLVIFWVRERKTAESAFKGVRISILNKNYLLFLFSSSLFALGSFSYSFLLVFANKYEFKTVFVPVLYLIFTVFAFLSSLPFGRLSDRLGRKRIIFAAFILWSMVCISFIYYPTHFGILAGFVLFGLHRGALDTVQNTLVSELVPEDIRASGLGGFQMIIGLCALPASLVAGFLWDLAGPTAPFYFSLVMTGLAMLMLLFVKPQRYRIAS
jgi:MFS family permease